MGSGSLLVHSGPDWVAVKGTILITTSTVPTMIIKPKLNPIHRYFGKLHSHPADQVSTRRFTSSATADPE